MPDTNEPLSRGRFLKLCAAGALGLAVTFAAACGEEDEEEDENGEDEEDEEDGGGGLY
jgi:ribosomal protein L12E/L44/L45/RPP1/RPP2